MPDIMVDTEEGMISRSSQFSRDTEIKINNYHIHDNWYNKGMYQAIFLWFRKREEFHGKGTIWAES